MEEEGPRVFQETQCSMVHAVMAVAIWLGPIYFNVALLVTAFFFLSLHRAFLLLGLLVLMALIPLNDKSKLGQELSRYVCKHVCGYFPVTLHVSRHLIPIKRTIFYVPILRHVWAWAGLTAATKHNFISLLAAGNSCIIVPGGLQEVFHMNPTSEIAFLNARKGFVRVAMEMGRPLVPVFCFGQTNVYKWWKPGGKFYIRFCRAIKFTPVLFWGLFGSPLPYKNPMHVVVGRPINVKKNPQPTMEEVDEVQSQFIEALHDLFQRHKARVGHPDLQLRIL